MKLAIDEARRQVAHLIGADPDEIVFTSGVTESINLGLKGILDQQPNLTLYTNKAEHSAVLDTCNHLSQQGLEVRYVGINSEGIVEQYKEEGLVE